MRRSDAGCGYNQLVYSSLVGLKQRDQSLFADSLSAARSVPVTGIFRDCVPKKQTEVQKCDKFSPVLIIFWHKCGQEDKIM